MDSKKTLQYRKDIDGLRAIAVILVVIFHAFPYLLPGGFIGVDVFFVISGYLITSIILNDVRANRFSFLHFYGRRFRRIVPALSIVLVSTWALGWNILLSEDFKTLGKHILAGATFTSNYILWRESGYFDSAAELKPLLHLWSLSVEEQFYLLWPAILVLTLSMTIKVWRPILILFLLSFLLNIWLISKSPDFVFYLIPARLWELLVGCALSYYENNRSSEIKLPAALRNLTGILCLGGLIAGSFFINRTFAFPGWWALLPTLTIAYLISAGPKGFVNRIFLSQGPLVYLGLISYPLYLWHWPLLSLGRLYRDAPLDIIERSTIVILSIILSWITFKYVELPVRNRLFASAFGRLKNWYYLVAFTLILLVLAGLGSFTQKQFFATYSHKKKLDILGDLSGYVISTGKERCFLANPAESSNSFNPECFSKEKNNEGILVWGDSFAAALYPGVEDFLKLKTNVTLLQLTTANCPPVIGPIKVRNSHCEVINNFVADKISANKIRTVIMFANWMDYWNLQYFPKELESTIHQLKVMGVSKILLVGQSPIWKVPLPDVLERYFIRKNLLLPTATKDGLDNKIFTTDFDMAHDTYVAGVKYVSLVNFLCSAEDCRIFSGGNQKTDLMTIDVGHFTEVGARYVVDALIGPLLSRAPP